MKPLYTKIVVALALAGLATLPTKAATYQLRQAVPGMIATTAAPAAEITLTLGSATVPTGEVGTAYSYDFKSLLAVTGDAQYNVANVVWSLASGSLPAGLSLSSTGVISGTPAAAANSSIQVQVAYKTQTALQTYTLTVNAASFICAEGYGAQGYACPVVVGAAPTNCPTDWVGVPSMRIPPAVSGVMQTVPAFCAMKYVASNVGGVASSSASGTPWVSISWTDANSKCSAAGGRLMRESEWMAIAHNLTGSADNWTGAAVASGDVKAGLQNSGAQAASGAQVAGRQRTLSTGGVIWDIGGNVSQWTYHDLAGGSSGAWGTIALSQLTAPYASNTRGMGGYPPVGYSGWGGYTPIRGGSGANSGPFYLSGISPSSWGAGIGFRCTK